ncbi:DUF669 domain-containing protein [Lactobacillus reuteri]|uniref:DUF669 domain-containing protein n=1 Tax=Limosilactobacillus reuteri TaxID=1598 RepID=UPI001469B64E|nr:DUF669 domain-containing protein [Limosilactobacillus reuteri]NMV51636.1 DUF669 domain-containing protein [Limosilactobacillus reuteri]NMV55832.1 DUF669 domain-containing protein [Limosilactobacillus reuteri]NMV64746.1 DUF669 domain-containing protein [Limosilactobacillus reuteri]
MTLFTVDSKNVFGKVVEEAGVYNVRVLPSTVLKKSRSGNAMVVMNYEVLDGKYAGGEIRYDNVTWIEGNQENVDKSVRRFNTIMVAADVPDGTPLNSLSDFVNGMIDKQLAIEVEWGEPNSNGDSYLTVRSYRKLMRDGSKPNGIKRPKGNNGSFNNGGSFTAPQQKAPAGNQQQPFTNNGGSAPIDIDNDQLPF